MLNCLSVVSKSGGKDSCFNLLHCVAEGHHVVALGNLRPLDKGEKFKLYNAEQQLCFQFLRFKKKKDLCTYKN